MRKSPQLSLIGMAISIKTLTLHLKVSCIQMDQAQMKAQELKIYVEINLEEDDLG